jgi:hypothetical protein
MDMDRDLGHGHAAWTQTWICSMDMDMQNGLRLGHAAWTWTCSIDMDIQHDIIAWKCTKQAA